MVQQSQKTLHVGGVILSSQGATIYSFDLEVFQPFSPTKCEPFPFCEKHVKEELLSSKRRGEEKGVLKCPKLCKVNYEQHFRGSKSKILLSKIE